MNTLQKIVVVFGLAGIALASLFPPWAVHCEARADMVTRKVTYAFLFDPPPIIQSPFYCQISLDLPSLLTVYVMIIAITTGLALLFGLKRSP